MRWFPSGVLLPLLGVMLASCTGTSVELVRPATPIELPALLSFSTAADVGEAGRLLDPGTNFGPEASQVVAVAQIGTLEDDGVELVVTWHHVDSANPEAPLFEHRIAVESGDIAFSTGLSPGVLALGRYEIRATLDDSNAVTRWMVSEHREAGGAGTAMATLGQDGPAGPEPPERGPSGTIPTSAQGSAAGAASSGEGDCVLTVVPVGTIAVSVDANGCGGDETTIAAGPPGGPYTVIGRRSGDFIKPFGVEPCAVGASDRPGAELEYIATIESGPHAGTQTRTTVRLPPQEGPPDLWVEADPRPGELVFRGDPILLTISASDADAGVALIVVRDEQGRELHTQDFAKELPEGCDPEAGSAKIAVVVDVPADAAEVFWVDVIVSDLSGNATTTSLAWPTRGTFTGLLVARVHLSVHEAGEVNDCRGTWHVISTIPVEGRGPVEGTANAEPLSLSCTYGVAGGYATNVDMLVDGTFDGEVFEIQFVPLPWNGFDGGLHLLYDPVPRTFDVRIEGVSGSTDISLSRTTPESETTLEGHLTLGCADCASAGSGG